MVYGYCRVSTKGQALANGLEAQEQEILNRYQNAIIKKESYTGGSTDRPILNEVLENLEEGDSLVVTKLDRLARNTSEGIELIKKLFERNISVHVLNVGLLENTNMGQFFITVLLAVAEMEKNTILERTSAGKAIAKQNPAFKEGRPNKFTKEQLDHAISLLDNNSYKQVERMTRISTSTLVREVRKRKITQKQKEIADALDPQMAITNKESEKVNE